MTRDKKRHAPQLVYLLTAAFFLILAGVTLWSNRLSLPTNALTAPDEINTYPHYSDNLVIPFNIAPLNFTVNNEAYEYLTYIYSAKGKPLLIKGSKVGINEKKWRKLLALNKGSELLVDVYVKRDGVWFQFPTIRHRIAPEPVDNWIVYRLTQPDYTAEGDLRMVQRNLESFKESKLTTIKRSKTPQDITKTTALFPAWHPKLSLAVTTVNQQGDELNLMDKEKSTPFRQGAHLVLGTNERWELTPTQVNSTTLEAFPSWSADGKSVYSSLYVGETLPAKKPVCFNLIKRSFEHASKSFGSADTVLNTMLFGKSATFPRSSPDDKHLLFCLTDKGKSPLWDQSSDLYLMDLASRAWQKIEAVNSFEADNQPCWSSNGRWVVFASNRVDGRYTRLYMAYFDAEGVFHKPFVLPQRNPSTDEQLTRSYNTPEFVAKHSTAGQLRLLVSLMDN